MSVCVLLDGEVVNPFNMVPFRQRGASSLDKPVREVRQETPLPTLLLLSLPTSYIPASPFPQTLTLHSELSQVFDLTEPLFAEGVESFCEDGVRLHLAICPQVGYASYSVLYGIYDSAEIIQGNYNSGWFVAKFENCDGDDDDADDVTYLISFGMHIGMWSCRYLPHGLRMDWAKTAVSLCQGFVPKQNLDELFAHIERSADPHTHPHPPTPSRSWAYYSHVSFAFASVKTLKKGRKSKWDQEKREKIIRKAAELAVKVGELTEDDLDADLVQEWTVWMQGNAAGWDLLRGAQEEIESHASAQEQLLVLRAQKTQTRLTALNIGRLELVPKPSKFALQRVANYDGKRLLLHKSHQVWVWV
jgi:hypothetical protein